MPRGRRLRGRVPAPLAALLAVAAVSGVAWAVVLPPLQGPDESGHVAYVQKLVEARQLPWHSSPPPAAAHRPSVSTEADTAMGWGAIEAMRGNLTGRAPASQVEVQRWRQHARGLDHHDRADGGYASVFAYPPLYYVYAAVPYAVTYPTSFFDRVLAMRLANVPLLLVVVVLTWLIAGEVFGRRRWLQTIAAGAVALNPQTVHLSSVVDPDPLLAVVWSGFLYLALLTLKRGPSTGRIAGIAALTLASCLTHPRGLALLPVAAVTVAWALVRHRRVAPRLRTPLIAGGVIAALLGAVAALDYGARGLQGDHVRGLVSYAWQFYLPRLPFMSPSVRADWTVRDAFVDRFWTFAQFDVSFSRGVLDALAVLSAVILVSAIVALVLRRAEIRRAPESVALFVVAVVFYILSAHLAAYRGIVRDPTDPVITGRYLVPLIAVFGVTVALSLSWLPRRLAGPAGGVVLGGMALLQVGALGSVLERFYA
jgi:hypothetical protein